MRPMKEKQKFHPRVKKTRKLLIVMNHTYLSIQTCLALLFVVKNFLSDLLLCLGVIANKYAYSQNNFACMLGPFSGISEHNFILKYKKKQKNKKKLRENSNVILLWVKRDTYSH